MTKESLSDYTSPVQVPTTSFLRRATVYSVSPQGSAAACGSCRGSEAVSPAPTRAHGLGLRHFRPPRLAALKIITQGESERGRCQDAMGQSPPSH